MAEKNTPVAETADEKVARLTAEIEANKKLLAAAPKPAATKQDNAHARGVAKVGITVDGETLMVGASPHRKFSTGSLGYHMFGKCWMDNIQYQVNLIITEIDSKPGK